MPVDGLSPATFVMHDLGWMRSMMPKGRHRFSDDIMLAPQEPIIEKVLGLREAYAGSPVSRSLSAEKFLAIGDL